VRTHEANACLVLSEDHVVIFRNSGKTGREFGEQFSEHFKQLGRKATFSVIELVDPADCFLGNNSVTCLKRSHC
jgi:hypothetical protein